MKIQIEGNLYLESDNMQYILKEYTVLKSGKNEGEEVGSVIGYYTDIHSALKKFMKMKIHESTAKSLQELSDDIRRIETYIKKLFEVELKEEQKIAI